MRVKCSICEKLETIDDDTLVAKRLRNRPIHTYMCDDCQERIKVKTEARIKTGRFSLYQDPATKEKKKKKGKKNKRHKKRPDTCSGLFLRIHCSFFFARCSRIL